MVKCTETPIPKTLPPKNGILLTKTFSSSNDIQVSTTFSSSNDIDNRDVFEEKKYLIQTYLVIATLLAALSHGTPCFVYVFFIIGILFYTVFITNTFFDRDTNKKGIDSRITNFRRELRKDKSIINWFAGCIGFMFAFLIIKSITVQANDYLPNFLVTGIVIISYVTLWALCTISLYV